MLSDYCSNSSKKTAIENEIIIVQPYSFETEEGIPELLENSQS
jgi:hypothetical protein